MIFCFFLGQSRPRKRRRTRNAQRRNSLSNSEVYFFVSIYALFTRTIFDGGEAEGPAQALMVFKQFLTKIYTKLPQGHAFFC